jgi:DNA-binding protein HU-beta
MEIRKDELVAKMAEKYEVSKKSAREMIETVVEAVKAEIAEGNTVVLPNFVKFEVQDTPAKKARNPKTGETVDVKASRKVTAKLSSNVKNSVKL